jgi:hypothetical protein
MLKLEYIYGSQLTLILSNPHTKQNDVIRETKTRYMLWPGKKYPMYSLESQSHWIIFIPRRVKARLCIYSSQINSIGSSPHAKQYDVIREIKHVICCGQE